jgi:integrase
VFASLLIAAGENPKAVQAFLGHATITMTFDLYGLLFPGSRDETRERVDADIAEAAAADRAT